MAADLEQREALIPRTPSAKGAAETRSAGADLGVGLGQDFPLRLELMLNPRKSAPEDETFIVLSDGGRNSRVYLGRITSGQPSSDRYVAIKLQTPRPPVDQPEDSGGLLTHTVRERRWLRELDHYRALSGSEQGFTPLHFIERAPERSGQADRPRPWPPLLYCNQRRIFFQPLSATGQPLSTCRKDDMLASVGLAPFSESSESYLCNMADADAGAAPIFYQPTREGQPIHPAAQTFEACLAAQKQIPGLPGAAAPSLASSEEILQFARLAGSFGCLSCPERETCYPSGPYAQRLEPFAFEDSNALVMDLNRYHYDEFCDILGKINWKEFQARHLGAGASAGQELRLRDAEALLATGQQYLFDSDSGGLDALEIFKLKWSLFTQTCKAVGEYHRRCGVAHLRIEPRHVMVQAEAQGEFLPTLWQFRARLISLGSAPLETRPEEGEKEEILALPMNSNPIYDAEIIRNSSFGVIQRGGFILKSVEAAKEEGKFVVKAEIQHDGIGMPWMSGKDRIKVILRNIVGLPPNLAFMSLLDPDHAFSQTSLNVRSQPISLKPPQVEGLKRIANVKIHNAGFVLYPLFHVPCDLFSLGMLLFRTLIVNDKQGIGDVSLAIEQLKQEIGALSTLEWEEGQEHEFLGALLEGQRRQNLAEVFDRSQIFFDANDRYKDRPSAIPKSLWAEAILAGLRLVSHREGFSICLNHGDYDPRYPASKLEEAAREFEEILRKIDAELLGLSRRNAEVRAALDAVFAEAAR